MTLTSVGYRKLGRAAARAGEKLMWVSAPKSWQERARKAGYEEELDAMREERIAQHKADMATTPGLVEVNAKGNPMRRTKKVTALPDHLKHKTIKTPSVAEHPTRNASTPRKVKPAAKPSVEALEGEVQDLNARIHGMQGTINAQRLSVEASIKVNKEQRLDISRQQATISDLEALAKKHESRALRLSQAVSDSLVMLEHLQKVKAIFPSERVWLRAIDLTLSNAFMSGSPPLLEQVTKPKEAFMNPGILVKQGDTVRFRPGLREDANPIHVGEVVGVSEGSTYARVLARPVDGSGDSTEFVVNTRAILNVDPA